MLIILIIKVKVKMKQPSLPVGASHLNNNPKGFTIEKVKVQLDPDLQKVHILMKKFHLHSLCGVGAQLSWLQ